MQEFNELSELGARLIGTAVLFLIASGFMLIYDMQVRDDDEPHQMRTRRRRMIAGAAAIGFVTLLAALWV